MNLRLLSDVGPVNKLGTQRLAKSENQQTGIDHADSADTGHTLDSLIGYNLKRAYMIVQADFRQALGDDGLTPRIFSVLSLVVEAPGITQSELSKMLSIERSGLVAIVDQLESAGYLERIAVPGDRRVQALSPTTKGKAMHASVLKKVRAHETRLFGELDDEERQQIASILRKFRRSHEQG